MVTFISFMSRYGIPAMFYFATTICGVIIAHWKILPADTSALPLDFVTTSQCCLIGLWLVHRSESWTSRILVPILFIGLTSSLQWAVDGMPVPANILWLSVYPLNKFVPLVGVTGCALLLSRSTKDRIISQNSMQFSVADILFVTAMFAIGFVAVMLSLPSLPQYQYSYGLGDSAQQMTASTISIVASTLIVLHFLQAPNLRIRTITVVIFCTLIIDLITARLLGIYANPLWASYALAPTITTLLVTISLLSHRRVVSTFGCTTKLSTVVA